MKKNSKYLIIALACVVVLGGAVAALTLTGGTGEDTSSSAAASSSSTIALIDKTDEDLASVTVTNETGTITIHAHTETIETSSASEEASSGSESASSEAAEPQVEVVYEVDGLEGLALSDNVSTVARAGYSLTAQKSIGTVENPEEFGLTDPTATVSAVYQDGSTYSYSIGVENGGYYYVQPDGSDEVYLASISSVLFNSINDLADTTLFELEVGEDTSSAASVAQTTGTYTESAILNVLHLSGTTFERAVTIEYDPEDGYLMTEPRHATADSTKMSEITTSLTSLSADSLVKAHPSQEDLESYGLADPAVVCEFTCNGKEYLLKLSATDADGNRYIVYDGVDAVFQIANSTVTSWADADPFYLQSTLTLLPNIVTVSGMDLTANGQNYHFTIDREEDEEESTEDNTAYIYTVTNGDGTVLDYEENFKHFYLTLISITVAEDSWEMPAGEPQFTCTFSYYDGSDPDTIEYYKVSDRRYAIVANGELMGLALSDTVDLAMNNLVLLNNGETVPDPN